MLNSIFAVQIKPDQLLGNIFLPYFVVKNNEDYYEKNHRISLNEINNTDFIFSDWMIKIVKKTHSISYADLNKKFNKKHLKITFTEFLNSADKKTYHFIRSYIEKIKIEISEIIREKEPFLFILKDRDRHIYNNNIIDISHEPAEIRMEFEKKHETLHYRLHIFHNKQLVNLNQNSLLLSNRSPSLVYNNKLFWFENENFNGNKLSAFLNKKEITVPSKLESVFFEKFIKPSVRNFNCTVKGFEIHEIKIKPKAELRIEKTIFGGFIFTPFFVYKTNKIHFSSKQRSFVSVEEKDGTYALQSIGRDYDLEKIFLSKLYSLGLKKRNNTFILDKTSKDKYCFTEQIREMIPELQQTGYRIINNLFLKKVSYDIPELSYTSNQKQDWFDLYIKVKFGKYEIEFIELKDHILNHIEEFELPDGSIAIIPEAWFSSLYTFAKRTKDNNKTSIHKTHIRIFENNSDLSPNQSIERSLAELKVKEKASLPKKSIANLREYQKTGYHWMYQLTQHRFGVCLADDMGLGKTLQVITLLQKYFETHNKPASQSEIFQTKELSTPASKQLSLFDEVFKTEPVERTEFNEESKFKSVLLVVPRSLIYNWVIEFDKFAPELSYSIYHSTDRKQSFKKILHKKNIIITTYGVIRKDIDLLKNEQFSYLILDESQVIKNPNSKIYQAVVLLDAQYRISMTGTPIENNLTDVWSQMNFLNHNILGNLNFFEKVFKSPILNNEQSPELDELKKIINPFILRRLKKDVAQELPEKTEQIIFCEMHPEQADLYEKEKSAIRNELISNENKKNFVDILAVLNRLRQIAIHPGIMKGNNEMTSGKFETIVQYIENVMEQGDKFLIFSSFVKHLDLFMKYFQDQNIKYSMLTGKDQHREKIVNEFETNDTIKPFLISIKAGGVGLNLTSASYVFIIDPWWNPFTEKQAVDRTHRIGQKKNIMVYRFISKDSIEEKILNLQKVKLKMSNDLIDSEITRKLKPEDLLKLI